MLKIWIWNHYATDMYNNHGGRHYWFAENLIKLGYDPTIFCANTFHNKREYIDTGKKKYITKSVNDITFVFVKTAPAIGNGFSRVKNMFLFFKHLFSVSQNFSKQTSKPDLIIASSVHPLTMVAGIRMAKKFKIPCICEIRDLWPEAIFFFNKVKEKSLLGKILIAGEHWIYKNADALIFTKEGDTDYLKERKWDVKQGGDIELEKCYYINNGVNLEEFQHAMDTLTIDDEDLNSGKFNVIYTGAIRPVNNVANILDAAAILKDYNDIQFLIYGDGNQLDNLRKRVSVENLTNVKLKGYINKQYIPYILSKSSVNLLNYSQTEYNWARGNSSNKLFEYMASGKPIISNVKMGYSIIDRYQCGFSLEESTPEELSKTILKIYNMPKTQYEIMGMNAENGAKDFNFSVLTKKLVNVIDKVMIK